MASKRSCLVCRNRDVDAYVRDRVDRGVSLRLITTELADRGRMRGMGYRRPPGPTVIYDHIKQHITAVAPISANQPIFATPVEEEDVPRGTPGDVATVIQQKSLEALESGEMRLTAAHALRAQDMIDRRAEKARDRELALVLARVLTQQRTPPDKYIEAEVVTVEQD